MRPNPLPRLCRGLAVLLALAGGAALADAPWDQVDAPRAKALHDKACISCHSRLYGGDGSGIYTRNDRLLSTRQGLLQRVAVCNAQAKAGWSRDQEAGVAAWLNRQYYHFAP